MKHNLNFVVDDNHQVTYADKKYIKINRRNKKEVLRGYRETGYTWFLHRLTAINSSTPHQWGYQQGASQIAGVLVADDVAGLLNSGDTFRPGIKLLEGDMLSITYGYLNPEIIGRARPYLPYGIIILQFNGESWQQERVVPYHYERLYKGILLIT